MRKIIKAFIPFLDIIIIPLIIPSAILMKLIRRVGMQYFVISKKILLLIGVFPIRNHYYEPLFDYRQLNKPISEDRDLPGINWNIKIQYSILDNFAFNDELEKIPSTKSKELEYYYNNQLFVSADADYLYNIIRLKKPKRIIEIGSGYSTLMAINAVNKNKVEDSNYECKHICIEPYEMSWLSKTDVTLIREKVEEISLDIFKELELNDILFIDSSHMIRPQGDVLFEYLQIFPSLQKGVIVHLHDIFTPKSYLKSWVMNEVKFWNEQYLLEAFLTSNSEWEILGALNYLRHNHFEKLSSKSPHLTQESEPGSFYMQKIA